LAGVGAYRGQNFVPQNPAIWLVKKKALGDERQKKKMKPQAVSYFSSTH
jgi:hypothetical protein